MQGIQSGYVLFYGSAVHLYDALALSASERTFMNRFTKPILRESVCQGKVAGIFRPNGPIHRFERPDVVDYRPAQNGLTAKEFFSYYEEFMKYFIIAATLETPSRWQ